MTSEQIRSMIERVYRQKDFSVDEYLLINACLIDQFNTIDEPRQAKDRLIREDLEFWRTLISYVPELEITNAE